MSSAVAPRYYCHQCSSEVNTYIENDERTCVGCKETFVEEMETPPIQETPPPQPPRPAFQPNALPFPFPGFSFANLSATQPGNQQQAPTGLPNFSFVQQMLNTFAQSVNNDGQQANGNIFDLFNNIGGMRMNSGSGMEDLLHRLFEQHMNTGPPPADKEEVEKLPRKIITEQQEKEEVECSVCKDSFTKGEEVLALPCNHLYHPDCILPWLKERNTCPTCRYELPAQKEQEKPSDDSSAPPSNSDSGPHHETDHLYM